LPPVAESLDVSVVIVLYDSAEVIAECLAALPAGVELVVVDNASRDEGAALVGQLRPDATVLRSGLNVGLGAANNLGVGASSRSQILFLNPDVRIALDAIRRLERSLAAARPAIVGPALVDERGRRVAVHHSPSSWRYALQLLPAAGSWLPRSLRIELSDDHLVYEAGGRVPYVLGCCFMIARADLDAIGGFDADLFLYDEEESLTCRIERLGGNALYEPRALATHLGSTSIAKVGSVASFHLYRSHAVLSRKRRGALLGRAALSPLMLALAIAFPKAIANSVLGRASPYDLAWWRAATGGLVAGSVAVMRSGASYH
jgi:GT2 family glycosyltransferase